MPPLPLTEVASRVLLWDRHPPDPKDYWPLRSGPGMPTMPLRTIDSGARPVLAGLAAALLVQATARAGDAEAERPAATGAALQQVVVSARRVRESPQDVPVSVDVFTDDDL